MENDILLAGHRPGDTDGIKIRAFPDGHIRVSFLNQNGHEVREFELEGIADLKELGWTIRRAVLRYEELHPEGENYLRTIRGALAPQVENVENALLNVK
jgi:hypothetical protein